MDTNQKAIKRHFFYYFSKNKISLRTFETDTKMIKTKNGIKIVQQKRETENKI